MAITYFGSTSTPVDNGTNTANPTIVTPPANMQDNDFVIIIACSANTSGTLSISETGGQAWTALTKQNTSLNITNVFWCDFNGTWTANPSITMAGTSNNIVVMHVFRDDGPGHWNPDIAEVSGTYAAPSNPYTVTINGITTQTPNAVAIAIWTSKDDNTWSDASGGSWANLGETQYRNTSGSYDQSVTAAYVVMPTAGATGDVSKNQTKFGGDAGNKYIIAFFDPPATYYVDFTTGDDEDSGLTEALAWKTIAKVNAASLSAGDSVLFKRGEEWREQLTVPSSGSAGLPITFGAYGTGDDPIITGFDVTTGWTQYTSGSGDGSGNLVDDNFDDGDYTGWSTTGTPEISTEQAYSGIYSVKFNAQETIYQVVTASSEIWVQCRFFMSVAATRGIIRLKAGVTQLGDFYYNNTSHKFEWYNSIGGNTLTSSSTFDPGTGTWYLLEFRWRKSATVGQTQLWINEASEFNGSNQNNGANDCDTVSYGQADGTGMTSYYDDCKVDNVGYIGTVSATNYWYKAHTVSGGGIVLEDGVPMDFVEWDTDPATSFAAATAPAATFDDAGNRVYVWCTANADPASKTMQVSVREHAIAIDGKNYIDVEDIDFTGAYLHGGHVTGTCSTLNFTDCDFYYNGGQWSGAIYLGNGFEVNGGTSTIVLDGCKGYQNFDIGFSVQMLTGNGNLTGATLTGCEAYQNRAAGFEILSGSGTGTMSNIRVTKCIARNNDGTGWSGTHVNESGIYVDSYIAANMSNVDICYNLIYANGIRGLYTLKNSTGAVPVEAYNNVIYDNGIGVVNTATLTFKNNAVAENASGEMNSAASVITADYNDYYHSGGGTFMTYGGTAYGFANWKTNSSQDANSISEDPDFISVVTPNFSLQATSPCINAGTDVGLTRDYEGTLVPQGAAPDMGAYEFYPPRIIGII